jgi:hypothetical protein
MRGDVGGEGALERANFGGFAGVLTNCSTWNNSFCGRRSVPELGLGCIYVGLSEFFDAFGRSISSIS